jgi:hypothetical protein
LALALGWGGAAPGAGAQAKVPPSAGPDPSITVRISGNAWTYSHDQLLAMARASIPNRRGNRQNPAIPLDVILFKDTGLAIDQVQAVFLIGAKVSVLRGGDLAYLSRLALKTGPDKQGRRHPWSLAPLDDEAFRAVAPHMGSHRRKEIYRINIVLKPDA